MQKTVWMMVIVLAVSLALTGCSSNEVESGNVDNGKTANDPNRSETLTVLTNRVDLIENGTLRQYAEQFEREHPGAAVEFQGLSNYTSDIMVRLSTRNMGDVLLLPANLLSEDLPKYFEPLPDEMFDSIRFKDYRSYEGVPYGMATGASTIGIVYNKKAFEKAGIHELPTTLSAFYAACEKLKKAGIIPVYINYGAQWPMKLWGE